MDLVDGRPIPVSGLVRAARAIADLSQRGLAQRTGITKSVLGRMETDDTGARTSLDAFVRALNACGFTVTVHRAGRSLRPDDDPERDRAHRRFPPHLDPHPPEHLNEWWSAWRLHSIATTYALFPPRVYHVSRRRRHRRRARLDHPWHARFWEDSAHLAPPFAVHPWVARRRRAQADAERRAAWWAAEEQRILREMTGSDSADPSDRWSAAGDGGANEVGGDHPESDP